MASARELDIIASTELLFDAIAAGLPQGERIQTMSEDRIYDANDLMTTDDMLEVMGKLEEALVNVHEYTVQLVDSQNDDSATRDGIDEQTRKIETYLHEHVDELQEILKEVYGWSTILCGFKKQYEETKWDYTNEYRNFVQNLKPFWSKLKQNLSSNNSAGPRYYCKVMKMAILSSLEARALSRRYEIETEALPGLSKFAELLLKRQEDRGKWKAPRKGKGSKQEKGKGKGEGKGKREGKGKEKDKARGKRASHV